MCKTKHWQDLFRVSDFPSLWFHEKSSVMIGLRDKLHTLSRGCSLSLVHRHTDTIFTHPSISSIAAWPARLAGTCLSDRKPRWTMSLSGLLAEALPNIFQFGLSVYKLSILWIFTEGSHSTSKTTDRIHAWTAGSDIAVLCVCMYNFTIKPKSLFKRSV